MEYNTEYIRIHYALMQAFMINAGSNILDVSYVVEKKNLTIQIVLLAETELGEHNKGKIYKDLPDYTIIFEEIYLTREKFNETKGEWMPKYYTWLHYLLFSKSEVI
ncbi:MULTISPECIES: hypothetical protein [Xanthocytophaga]|uniref:Uncharacterized protein n=1 Tax=Xanthocytophaga agilis TaxID=3048010 RepID=A0AAE3UJS8_9BACT|nr:MULTISPECIES: hypothetical protein [Xanthocytophaga]MDJ1466896.1 hypothetical protein [Xanthocytophaga flavus]MDJ1505653.1 hypothetical protein [Xanthocytophaga agilis]